jgi:cytochrome c oxidase subunit 3
MSTQTIVMPGPKGPGLQAQQAARLGLWAFLATVTMLFAAFTSAYIVRQSGDGWSPIALPSILWRNTAILVASSVALEMAWQFGRRGKGSAAGAAFGAALTLGGLFLYGQVLAWQSLRVSGVLLPSSSHGAFVYLMTVAHALHVLAALGVLGWGAAATWRGLAISHAPRWTQIVGTCRTFWHFLLAVWVYLFALVSVY